MIMRTPALRSKSVIRRLDSKSCLDRQTQPFCDSGWPGMPLLVWAYMNRSKHFHGGGRAGPYSVASRPEFDSSQKLPSSPPHGFTVRFQNALTPRSLRSL